MRACSAAVHCVVEYRPYRERPRSVNAAPRQGRERFDVDRLVRQPAKSLLTMVLENQRHRIGQTFSASFRRRP